MADADPPDAQPEMPPLEADVSFIYQRRKEQIHLEQHGLGDVELVVLMTACWLQFEEPTRNSFVAMLQAYQDGSVEPPPVARGIAAIVRRGKGEPPPPHVNGHEISPN